VPAYTAAATDAPGFRKYSARSAVGNGTTVTTRRSSPFA
jgi:hypothetical protein